MGGPWTGCGDSDNNAKLWVARILRRLQQLLRVHIKTITRPDPFIGCYLDVLDNKTVGDESGYAGEFDLMNTGSAMMWAFFTTLANPLDLDDPSLVIPFQVGFYGGPTG